MTAEKTHRDLMAWQEAMTLAEFAYQVTEGFPSREHYGLAAQIRKAAVSVPSNISEGAARNSSREFFQYLGIAIGSLAEMETQLELSMRLGYLPKEAHICNQVHRVGRLVNALRNSFRIRTRR